MWFLRSRNLGLAPRCDRYTRRQTPPCVRKLKRTNEFFGDFPFELFRIRREHAETRDRTGDLQIFGLTLSQLSYRGSVCVRLVEIFKLVVLAVDPAEVMRR